jgi:mRNA interferase RelE/StbE
VAFKIDLLDPAVGNLAALSQDVRNRIVKKLRWLGENAALVVHHRLSNMPIDLAGLCRMRVGDYRILYWCDDERRTLTVYRVAHRRSVYGAL